MESAVAAAVSRFGTLHGVIHAANVIADALRPVETLTRADCESHFHPRVRALFVLENVLHGRRLDFCVLTSTTSSVLGGLGLAGVSAASAFADAFAHGRNQAGPTPWISVDWDPWRFDEGHARGASAGAKLAGAGITPEEAGTVFGHILAGGLGPQVIVSAGDLQARISAWVGHAAAPETEEARQAGSGSLHPRPELPNAYVAPRNDLEQGIVEVWQKMLGIGQIGVYDNFTELGGDSLLATRVVSRLRDAFQVNLPLRLFFEKQTVAGLAEEFEATFLREVAALTEEEAQRLLQ